MQDQITAAVINFQTPDLLEIAVRSFNRVYPEVPLLIIDNGSKDDSVDRLKKLSSEIGPVITELFNEENVFHGPAMDQAMKTATSEYVYIFDSDTVTLDGGFLEEMLEILSSEPRSLAIGKRVSVNKRGFLSTGGIPVPVSAYMLLRKSLYMQLSPFEHHGLPVLKCCTEAARKGWRISPFDIDSYVRHDGRGTAKKFGYGLGWKSRVNYLLNRLGL
jgi:GT2 family glycosyltransferase